MLLACYVLHVGVFIFVVNHCCYHYTFIFVTYSWFYCYYCMLSTTGGCPSRGGPVQLGPPPLCVYSTRCRDAESSCRRCHLCLQLSGMLLMCITTLQRVTESLLCGHAVHPSCTHVCGLALSLLWVYLSQRTPADMCMATMLFMHNIQVSLVAVKLLAAQT